MSNNFGVAAADIASDGRSFIELRDIGKTFETKSGDVEAIGQINLSVRQNQFIAIVGPSGCGKSTLLKIVAGLVAPSSGLVRIYDDNERPLLGMVFQHPALLPWRTVLANILLPTEIVGQPREEAAERARGLLQLVRLADFASKYPSELSGGMQMRAALCRALICEPSLLLMDEPFGALDAMTREDLSLELLRIWQRKPKTVLFVTHSISEAILLADQVVVISSRPGHVVETVDIDIGRPRGIGHTESQAFRDYLFHIRSLIVSDQQRPQAES